jgi:hypothetical protein
LSPVALSAEVDLGRVDLDEANALPVPEHDRVAIDDVVDPKVRLGEQPARRVRAKNGSVVTALDL